MFNLECPNCQHTFCGKCLRRTWQRPLRNLRDNASAMLTCCSCKKENEQKNWHEVKNAEQPKQTTYPDLFGDEETKI